MYKITRNTIEMMAFIVVNRIYPSLTEQWFIFLLQNNLIPNQKI